MQCWSSDELCSNCGFFTGILYVFVFIAMTVSADMTATRITMHIVESRIFFFVQKKAVLLHSGVLGTNYSFPALVSGGINDSSTFHLLIFPDQPVGEVEYLCV